MFNLPAYCSFMIHQYRVWPLPNFLTLGFLISKMKTTATSLGISPPCRLTTSYFLTAAQLTKCWFNLPLLTTPHISSFSVSDLSVSPMTGPYP